MAEKSNLAGRISERLPKDLNDFIRLSGEAAERRQQCLYLVGGVVRDLLLERHNLDLDLVVEGDAIELAQEMAGEMSARVTKHNRFGTANLRWSDRSADMATARAETYNRPGALPVVKPGTIKDDLARRDLTINAIAVELNPRRFGNIIDPHRGRWDIDTKLVRVLHENSFIDDPTRIWRALRYEQRLDFHLEPTTLDLLIKGITYLGTVSGDRIRHELERILKEEMPEKALRRADELGALKTMHPSLRCDDWLTETFVLARERYLPGLFPSTHLYLALLCYRLTSEETEELVSNLRLPGAATQVLQETMTIKQKINELAMHGLSPSRIYGLVHGYSTTALTANALAAGSAAAAGHIELYMNVLRHVNPALNGEDLKKMGVPEGPKMKEILQMLREARLDGKVTSRKEEVEMVRSLLQGI